MEAKDQHYIPKFYLKGFTDKGGTLWVYEQFKPIKASRPKLEAHRPDYYTHSEMGERDETVEDLLKKIESNVAPVIRKIGNPQYTLTPEAAGRILEFVAFMFARVPSWREYLDKLTGQHVKAIAMRSASSEEKFRQLCSDFEKSTGKYLGYDIESLRKELLSGKYEVQPRSAVNLRSMVLSAVDLIEELKRFDYQVLYAPADNFFLTSDCPVFSIQPDGKGKATVGSGFCRPNVELYFPLNKRTCWRMRDAIALSKQIEAKESLVAQINKMVMVTATQYVYSSQSHRRIARLFDERGCQVRAGKNAFL